MENRLDRLREALLVLCFPRDVTRAMQLADRPGAGLVVTTDRHDDVRLLAAVMGKRPLLIDAARHAGGQLLAASAGFDRRWLVAQRDEGLPVLTDSGYVAEGDEKGLLSVLHRTAGLRRAGDVVAVLALHPGCFIPRGGWIGCSSASAGSGCRSRSRWTCTSRRSRRTRASRRTR